MRAVVFKVTSTAICGSDLYIHPGFFPQLPPFGLGHEFLRIVYGDRTAPRPSTFACRSPTSDHARRRTT